MSDILISEIDLFEDRLCLCGTMAQDKQTQTEPIRTILANGLYCLDCEKFYCKQCSDRADKAADAKGNEYDSQQCPACNAGWDRAGF